MSPTQNVFVSHSSKDIRFSMKLAADLSEYGVNVWLDETELLVGDSLTERIKNAIQSVDYLLLILSSNSINSKWVKKELRIALEEERKKSKKIVIPIYMEKLEVRQLKDRIYVDFTDKDLYHRGFQNLLKILGHTVTPKDRLNIFSGERSVGWENWSWYCEYDENCLEYSNSDKQVMKISLNPHGGVAFAFRSGINTQGYRNLEFNLNGGVTGGQLLKIFFNDRIGDGIRKPVTLDRLPPEEWIHFKLTLEELGAVDIIIVKVNITEAIGENISTFYLDDLCLTS